MTESKHLWILAGGNGAGKSTFYRLYLSKYGIKFINADLIAKEIDSKNPEDLSYQAAALASKIREDLIIHGVSFCFETVFSHESKIDFIAKARAHGYKITLVYIHLSSSELNEARVHQRVSEGGHSVSSEKIHSRIPRTMKHIKTALPLVDDVRLLDNSSIDDPFLQVAIIKSQKCEELISPLPKWAREILGDYEKM
ncbi:MAG: zeta toxin family protein [Desulfobacteraceae bacterium]|nr:zeta toxin family protein [Desulfobacteraceae bacterium]